MLLIHSEDPELIASAIALMLPEIPAKKTSHTKSRSKKKTDKKTSHKKGRSTKKTAKNSVLPPSA